MFLYTNIKQLENNIPKRTKYLGINLTEDVQNLYTKNDKILVRENKDLHKFMNHVCELEESVVFKWQLSQNIDAMKFQSKFQQVFLTAITSSF